MGRGVRYFEEGMQRFSQFYQAYLKNLKVGEEGEVDPLTRWAQAGKGMTKAVSGVWWACFPPPTGL